MCIAIYKPENILIDKETLEECYRRNSDGAGYMFHKNDKLYVKKGFFSFKEFWNSYRRDKNKECVIHFRIKTHGQINKDNCHPYMVNDNFAFVHNGVISGYSDTNKSDTWLFNEDVIQPFVSKWGNLGLFEDPVKKLIESRIGYSKLIFMDNKGNSKIFNEDKGVWDKGVWYSNTTYKKLAPIVPATPVSTYKSSTYVAYKDSWGYKRDHMTVGKLVCLNSSHYDWETKVNYPKGSLWEVVAVNKDYSVDLMSDDEENPAFIYNVRFHAVDFYEEEEPYDPTKSNSWLEAWGYDD